MTDLLYLLSAGTPFTGEGAFILPNEHVHWGPIVWAYLYLAGLGSGNLIVALLPRLPWAMDSDALMRLRRIAIITALASFIAIPIAVLASLHQPLRMWRVILAPHAPSAMPYGSWTLVILIGLTVFHLWHMHRAEFAYAAEHRSDLLGRLYRLAAAGYDPDATTASSRTLEVVHYARIAVELAFIAYTGFLLSSMVSHPVWATPTLGIMFFLLAMATGYAWLAMVGWLSGFLRDEPRMLQLLAGSGAAFLAGVMGLRVWEMAWGAYLDQSWWDAFAEMQFSHFAWSFFGVEALGGLVAIGTLAYASWRNDGRTAWVGGALSLVVLMVVRWHLVVGGQMVSRTRAGLVPFEVQFLGAEGVIATVALFVLTATIIAALLWFLPWRTALHATSVDETQPEEVLAEARSADRRRFLTVAGGLTVGIAGGYATVGDMLMPQFNPREPGPTGPTADRVVNSICLSCDARCGARAVINSEGRVRNVYGNPFHPASTMNQPIPFETSLDDSLKVNGTLCMKGVSGMQYLYDPYRIRLPLKRTGPRGRVSSRSSPGTSCSRRWSKEVDSSPTSVRTVRSRVPGRQRSHEPDQPRRPGARSEELRAGLEHRTRADTEGRLHSTVPGCLRLQELRLPHRSVPDELVCGQLPVHRPVQRGREGHQPALRRHRQQRVHAVLRREPRWRLEARGQHLGPDPREPARQRRRVPRSG